MKLSDTITIRRDRLEEIEDFIAAMDEWGATDTEIRQRSIAEFLQSPIGLTQYLERDVAQIIGHA